MSIKKLFDSHKANNTLTSTSLEEEVVKNAPELESADNVREQIERINRFIPQVDFSDPQNFARYGSAQSYYEDAIKRITNTFPYDGSEEETTRFHNESNYLDKYIFDNDYPRTNGYATFAVADDPDATIYAPTVFTDGPILTKTGWTVPASTIEYIKVFGGPNAVEDGMTSGSFHTDFTGSNHYDTDIYATDGTLPLDRVGSRESNLKFKLTDGITTEFWINANSDWPNGATAQPANQIIYDQWNGAVSSSNDYGRLLVYLTSSIVEDGENPIVVHLASGSNVWDTQFGGSTVLTGTLKDTWNHVALSFISSSDAFNARFYLNGSLIQTNSNTSISSFGEVTGSLIGYIGAGQTSISGNANPTAISAQQANPFNPFSGSMDEFRYWKTARTEKEILENYWTQVRGGTNKEIANAELGVYYKFNEGITGTSSVDSVVLDYSGRLSNGTWTNYPGTAGRSTDSAIVSASAATSEYKDPIIRSNHPDVLDLYNKLSATGSLYDDQNHTSLMDSMPGWIRDEDEAKGSDELKKLTQILGSYFDTLQLQTENLPSLKGRTYTSASFKPTPFSGRLLSGAGLAVPDIFIDATLLERFANRNADQSYSLDINEVKSLIYQNIYNNLTYLYKSKGTEKAFRNLVRCYGIGDDIVKFNAYGNNTTFNFSDTHQATTIRKNYVNFNHPDRFDGVVYQNTSSTNSETGNATYISGSGFTTTANHPQNVGRAYTAELEVVFPKKFDRSNSQYFSTPFITSSIFGWASASLNDPTNFTRFEGKNLHLYAVRTNLNSKDAYFVLSGNADGLSSLNDGITLTSDVYSNIYDNQKWNFALRVKHKHWPNHSGAFDIGATVNAGAGVDDVDIELHAVNVEDGVVKRSFTLTTSSVSSDYMLNQRRFQIGAYRSDFTGSTISYYSDVKASSLRYYDTYLNDAVIKAHALDSENFGTLHPNRNFIANHDIDLHDNIFVPEVTSLAMNIDFGQVTGSDAIGTFTVEDASSGTMDNYSRYNDSTFKRNTQQHAMVGYFPNSVSSTSVISKEYVQSLKQRLPEVVNTDDAVNVLSRDDEFFPRDREISQTFFAFEKSMYGVVSQEMLNMFATIIEFNDLIGKLTNKYRGEHKDLKVLRNLFFEKIQNDPDLDKFIDYYKWIDASLSIFLQQFVPASANVSDEIRVMVEDYILGRSKYRHQYPHLDYKGNARWGGDEEKLEARVRGIKELTYNWQFGKAPIAQQAAATITVADGDAASGMTEKEHITITSTDGTTKRYVITDADKDGSTVTGTLLSDSGNTDTGAGTAGSDEDGGVAVSIDLTGTAVSQNAFLVQLKAAIEHANGHNGKIKVSAVPTEANGAQTITLTQAQGGLAGNSGAVTTSTGISTDISQTTVTQFTGGDDKQDANSLWWKDRVERDLQGFDTNAAIDSARQSISDIILSFNSASADRLSGSPVYEGSAYAVRNFTRPIKLSADIVEDIGGGYNYPRGQKPDALFPVLPTGDDSNPIFGIRKISSADVAREELRPVMKQERRSVPAVSPATITKVGDDLVSNKYLVPFVAYSSSVSPTDGFGQSWQSTDNTLVPNAEEFAGYHNDSYGDDYEVPMQGPFTNQHVGGNRHRHIDLNTGSSPDTHLTRPEAWNQFTTTYTRFVPADGKADSISTNPQYRRDETAKRPVNIKNIKHRTGSHDGTHTIAMGNFNKRYETVSTTGRHTNNSSFVKSEGFSTASVTDVTVVDGLLDYAKATRTRAEHVIVSRFSAPGSPETMGDAHGGAGLDYESAELSPYNNLNYRNTTVREPLKTLLRDRSEQFGLRSGSAVSSADYTATASYHKVNRNGLRSLGFSDLQNTVRVTGSTFDNYYVQHMIPRSDYQYSWITASSDRFDSLMRETDVLGYFPYDGLIQISNHATAIIEVADGDAATGMAELEHVTITSTDGTTKRYVVINDNATTVTLGTVLEAGSDYGSSTLSAGDDAIGGIAVPVYLTGVATTQNGFLHLIKEAIEHANGHNGKILVGTVPTEANGAQSITITQATPGVDGNKSITSDISQINFGAGVDAFRDGRNKRNTGAVRFVSSSEIGTGFNTANRRPVDNIITSGLVQTDFVGINTTIVEPPSASSFTLGYPLEADVRNYYNFGDIGSFVENTLYKDSYIERLSPNAAARALEYGYSLNHILNHRGCVYGYSTWKQIRVGETQLPRYYRKNNFYTHTPYGGQTFSTTINNKTRTIVPRNDTTLMVSQSVVTSRYPAITHELNVRAGTTPRGRTIKIPIVIESSFANSLVSFDDVEFANRLRSQVALSDTPYRQIRRMYANGALKDPASPVAGVNRIIYREVVYPSLSNSYTSKVRGRTDYTNNFWKDSRTDRRETSATNAAGASVSQQSRWPLDGPETAGATEIHHTGGIVPAVTDTWSPGELQNTYTHFLSPLGDGTLNYADHTVNRDDRKPGVLYSRKHMMPFKNSVAIVGGGVAFGDITITARAGSTDHLMPSASTGTGEAVWTAATLAGRFEGADSTFAYSNANPFYDTYDEYFADVKPQGQSFSIVPEYRITDHLDLYDTEGGNFLIDNLEALQIVGTPAGGTVPQNSDEDNFFKVFTNSDFMKYFEVVRQDHRGVAKPRSVKLRCKAVTKFLPYDGFYPADRTVEIASAFSSSYGDAISYSGTDSDISSRYNVFMKPFFAPGILYNTIKGGLAVDYPIMTGSYLSIPATGKSSNDAMAAIASSSYQIVSNSRKHSKTPTTVTSPVNASFFGYGGVTHNDGWDKRIPFEALVSPERYLTDTNIVSDEPSPWCHVRATASWNGARNNDKYRNMMHNFLASSMDFFLRNGKPTQILSKPQSEWLPVTPGQPYGMRVKIYRSRSKSKATTGDWGDYPIPQHQMGDGKATFEMYSRASAYGPPVGSGTGSYDDAIAWAPGNVTGTLAPSPARGVYASHTPPYYDGESWVDIIYYPFGDISSATASVNEEPTEGVELTLRDVHQIAEIKGSGSVFSTDAESSSRYGHQGTYVVKWRFDQEGFKGFDIGLGANRLGFQDQQYGLYSGTGTMNAPMSGVWVNKWAMQGDASLNLFEKAGKRWKIATKFETPMLNFAYVTDAMVETNSLGSTGANARNNTIPRGMWHQFGRIPQEDEGVYIQVTDIPSNWLENHPSGNIMYDPAGRWDPRNSYDSTSARTNARASIAAKLSGYKFPINYAGGPVGTNYGTIAADKISASPKSLVEICGFNTEPVKVGKLRDRKKVYEAVVAVPFIEQDGERKFFKTISPDSVVYDSVAGRSIKRQERLMKKYVFPPSLDFVQNKGVVDPVAMYIFEFSHKFDMDDLSHMWQNLAPKSGRKSQIAMASVSHPLLVNELLGNPQEAIDSTMAGEKPYHTDFPKKLQWMVFKVKQRAKSDYYKAIKKTTEPPQVGLSADEQFATDIPDIALQKEEFVSDVPFYTHNWPYDHFSLVELAEIEASVTFGKTRQKPKPVVGDPPNTDIEAVPASPDLIDLAATDEIEGSAAGLAGDTGLGGGTGTTTLGTGD